MEDEVTEGRVIAPSKATKNSKFRSEVIKRENLSRPAFLVKKVAVDPDCEIPDVEVYEDYSCLLNLVDITYSNLNQNKFYKIQLLERKDKKKWFMWVQLGRVNAENASEKVNDFYNKFDAIAAFEQRFFERTGNKWTERNSF